MNTLSEISLLIGERAGDLEKGREIFTAESRGFVNGILTGIRHVRSDPWTQGRVRVDLPAEIDTEPRSAGFLSSQFAFARCVLRFKRGVKFQQIAELSFGLEFDQALGAFVWQVTLVPAARFQRIDDLVWNQYKTVANATLLPLGSHMVRANTIRFVQRALNKDLTLETAFNDVKHVLEFLLSTDAALAEAVGLEPWKTSRNNATSPPCLGPFSNNLWTPVRRVRCGRSAVRPRRRMNPAVNANSV